MRVCPKCGFIEEMEWHPTTWKSAQYIDCCRLSDLENIDPALAKELLDKSECVKGIYAYRLTKPKVWVLRRWLPIFKVQGWKEIPAEQHQARKIGTF
jgi:hypothetical protein